MGINFNRLVATTRKYYQNQVAQGEYNKVDPIIWQIMALTTQLENLKSEPSNKAAHYTAPDTSGRGSDNSDGHIPELDEEYFPGTELYK